MNDNLKHISPTEEELDAWLGGNFTWKANNVIQLINRLIVEIRRLRKENEELNKTIDETEQAWKREGQEMAREIAFLESQMRDIRYD